ncbi:YiiG family protein [Clostridium lundense]|uniref:YiiG family protein n=1 Tax=Clostridium lundense TaxID=319475 RepID=UPI0004839263|nr:YiiG family protein [Clostridium lundense]
MFRKIALAIIMCIVVSTIATSCEYREKKLTIKDKAIPKETGESYNKKYEAYATLDTFITGNLQESLDYYFSKFGDTEEFKVDKNDNLYNGILLEFNKKELEEGFSYYSTEPHFEKVDNALKELHPAFKELIQALSDADTYYKLKSYVDDDFVKGKELHKKIYSKYIKVKPLNKKFSSDFGDFFREDSKKKLEEFKKNDFMIKYYALSSLLKAKDLESELQRQKVTKNNMASLDVSKYKEKYNLLVADMNKFLEYSKDSNRIKKEKIDPAFPYKIMDVKAAATDILTKAQGNNSYKNSGYSRNGEGTTEYLSNKIKEAILEYVKMK